MEKILITAEEAAEVLSVGRTTVYELIKVGALHSIKIGRSRRIATTEVTRYVEQLNAEPTIAARPDLARV